MIARLPMAEKLLQNRSLVKPVMGSARNGIEVVKENTGTYAPIKSSAGKAVGETLLAAHRNIVGHALI